MSAVLGNPHSHSALGAAGGAAAEQRHGAAAQGRAGSAAAASATPSKHSQPSGLLTARWRIVRFEFQPPCAPRPLSVALKSSTASSFFLGRLGLAAPWPDQHFTVTHSAPCIHIWFGTPGQPESQPHAVQPKAVGGEKLQAEAGGGVRLRRAVVGGEALGKQTPLLPPGGRGQHYAQYRPCRRGHMDYRQESLMSG